MSSGQSQVSTGLANRQETVTTAEEMRTAEETGMMIGNIPVITAAV